MQEPRSSENNSLPSTPTPNKDLFYLPVLFFLMYIDVRRGFTLVFYTCIYHVLIKLISSVTYSLSVPLLFNSLQCILLYYLHTQMKCSSIFFTIIFFLLSCVPIVPSDRPTNTIIFSLDG
jgi:hypothetical protein